MQKASRRGGTLFELWSIFMISLELTLSKIPEKIHSLRPAARRR